MSRIVNTNSPASQRTKHRKVIAEALRCLVGKSSFDREAEDATAAIVLSLLQIEATVDQSAKAWEKRNYFVKADRFRHDWEWAATSAAQLHQALLNNAHADIIPLIASLSGRFQDVKLPKVVPGKDHWRGYMRQLRSRQQSGSS